MKLIEPKMENTSLLERNLNLLCIVSDLNTKIKDLENDKMSLMTTIKLPLSYSRLMLMFKGKLHALGQKSEVIRRLNPNIQRRVRMQVGLR